MIGMSRHGTDTVTVVVTENGSAGPQLGNLYGRAHRVFIYLRDKGEHGQSREHPTGLQTILVGLCC